LSVEWVEIGPHRLACGDAADILPSIEFVDAIVTDPPYGIGEARKNNASRSCLAQSKDYGVDAWDDAPCSDELIGLMQWKSQWQIIFGGNYFKLPPSPCWLVWDKENGNNDFADCELAWTNLRKAVRRIHWQWHGMIRKGNEERYHPTQKPVGVMKWCIEKLPSDCNTICDPFAGSGTTGVACAKLGKRFIGIEREPKYFDIACRRIESALKSEPLLEGVA
jgi:DNA modification methylase